MQILIALSAPMYRIGLSRFLEKHFEKECLLDSVRDGDEAIEKATLKNYDLIFIENNLSDLRGIVVLESIIKSGLNKRIIFLSNYNDSEAILNRAFKYGAATILSFDIDLKEFEKAVDTVLENRRYLSPQMIRAIQVISNLTKKKEFEGPLTKREVEVIQMVGKGLKSNEIAIHLGISTRTVQGYRYKACKKAGCKNTAQLIQFGLREGIIPQ